MTELEWMARNEHTWNGPDDAKMHMSENRNDVIYAVGCADGCGITKPQWQAERERLQNKPSWDDAPKYSQWLCQDADGLWKYCIARPPLGEKYWIGDIHYPQDTGKVLGDWRDTLERRPDAIECTPGLSLDDIACRYDHLASFKYMSADTRALINTSTPKSKYHREIAPGVWVDVYDVIDAFAVTCPALQHLIKKALAPGQRGHKDTEEDLRDIVRSADRAVDLHQKREARNVEA